jgi:amino acid transporter
VKDRVRRDVGGWALLFTGIGSIIGSGWLFGAGRAAAIAGPAAIIAWVIGGLVVLTIAGLASELGGMFPETGGTVRYAYYTHGSLIGFLSAWANWLAIVTVIPIEAEASIQYMSSWPFAWSRALFQNGELTFPAILLSGALIIVFFLLNYWGVRLFARVNTLITVFKLIVPALTALALISTGFHAENVTGANGGGFMPYGIASVLTAVATSGIIFAFNGFQSPLNLAGEARNPGRDILFSVVGSVLICGVVYLLLQVAFLGAVDPVLVSHGWSGVKFSSPFAQLAMSFGLTWLAMLLYFDAFVSPSGTGVAYVASTSRMIFATARGGMLPAVFAKLHPITGAPRPALWFNFVVSFIFLAFFRGWSELAAVISVATVISFLMMPVCALSLRRVAPDLKRPIRLPGMRLLAPLGFVFASLLLYWARWPLTGKIILLLLVALPVYAFYQDRRGWGTFRRQLQAGWWFVAYLLGMALLSAIGSEKFGGLDIIPFGWDLAAVTLMALRVFWWGTQSAWRTPELVQATLEVNAAVRVL